MPASSQLYLHSTPPLRSARHPQLINTLLGRVLVSLQAVNGILIPGGAQDLRPGQPFFDTVSQLVDLAIAANDKGNYFPVRGSKAHYAAGDMSHSKW